jgi:undecaprenyl-diphosphatase
MNIVDSIILGIIQGVTEFLPISSSGHLALAEIFGLISEGDTQSNIAFFIILHMGTLAAVVVYMRKDIGMILTTDRSLILPLFVSTLITAAVAIPLKKYIEKSYEYDIIIGVGFLFTAAVIVIGEYVHRRRNLNRTSISIYTGAVIGLLQGITPFAGISRSGTTISAGFICGLDRKTSASYSFLLAIPAIAGSMIFDIGDICRLEQAVPAVTGFITSFIFGYAAIALLLRIVKTRYFVFFSLYTAALGLTIILFRIMQ